MPHLNFTMNAAGPQIDVWVAVSDPRRTALLAAKQSAPAPAIDPGVMQKLQIPVSGQTSVFTPSTGALPHVCHQYDISMAILDMQGRPMYVVPAMPIIESELAGQGIDALLGRDVLSQAVLIYNGAAGVFTLSF